MTVRHRLVLLPALVAVGVFLAPPAARGAGPSALNLVVTGARDNLTAGGFINGLRRGIELSPYLRAPREMDDPWLALLVTIVPVDHTEPGLEIAYAVVLVRRIPHGKEEYLGSLAGVAGRKVAYRQGLQVMEQVDIWVQKMAPW